jgi:hypothetical protein
VEIIYELSIGFRVRALGLKYCKSIFEGVIYGIILTNSVNIEKDVG